MAKRTSKKQRTLTQADVERITSDELCAPMKPTRTNERVEKRVEKTYDVDVTHLLEMTRHDYVKMYDVLMRKLDKNITCHVNCENVFYFPKSFFENVYNKLKDKITFTMRESTLKHCDDKPTRKTRKRNVE